MAKNRGINSIRKILLAAARLAGFGVFLALAAPQPQGVFAHSEMTGTTHKVHRSVTAQGGNRSGSSSHILGATAGEPISGLAASTSHKLAKGFWSVSNYPGTITTLVAVSSDDTSVVNLSWVAPGSDGTVNRADRYIIRYASCAIGTELGFSTAISFSQSWTPLPALSRENRFVDGLTQDASYYFCVKATTGVSNNVHGFISTGTVFVIAGTPPSRVTDLSAASANFSGDVRLNWTSPGDDGTVGTPTLFLIKMATAAHLSPASSDDNFNAAQNVASSSPVPVPLAGGASIQFMLVTGLSQNVTYYFAMKAVDEMGLRATLSFGATLYNAPSLTPITSLSALAGINVGSVRLQWTVPQALPSGSTAYIQYSTSASTVWSAASAQLASTVPALSAFNTFITTAGGLDVGVDGSNANISPTYYFRVFTSTGANAYSAESNGSTRTAALPTLPTSALTSHAADNGWMMTVNGSQNAADSSEVAYDSSGNMYAGAVLRQNQNGGSGVDWMIRKIDSAGAIQWTKFFNSNGNSTDGNVSITADSSGNSYVAGSETRSDLNQNENILVRKYDANGTLVWVSTSFNSAGSNVDRPDGVAVDGSGNVYVTGLSNRSDISQGFNMVFLKYNSSGQLQFANSYNSAASNTDAGKDIAVDGSGNIYVTGFETRSDLGLDEDMFLRKYDSAGLLVWATTYIQNISEDEGYSVTLDPSGNPIVAGRQWRGDVTQNFNATIWKFDSSSLLLWTTTYNSPSNGSDVFTGVRADSLGNIHVIGNEVRSDLGQNTNILLRKYNPSGLLIWTTSYNSPTNSNDSGASLGVDAQGIVYAAGVSGINSDDAWLRRYVQNSPQTPTGLVGVAQSSSSILWTWVDVSTGIQYQEEGLRIVRSTDGIVLSTYPFMSTGTSSYLLAGLSPNASATLYLQAYNIAGTSNTAPIIAYSSANIPLTNGSTFTAVTGYSITAAWLSNNNPSWTQYVVDISTWNGFAGTVTSSTTFLTSVSTTGLAEASTYYFRVTARNGNGFDTPYLDLGYMVTPDVLQPISSLSALAGINVGSVRLQWTVPETLANGSTIYIHYSTSANTSWSAANAQIVSTIPAVSQYQQFITTAGGLDVGVNGSNADISPTYYFRVFASTALNSYSTESNGSTRTAALPTLPTNSFTNYGATDGWYASADGSGAGTDNGFGIAQDGSGNLYVSGWFIENGGTDGFVRKYNSAGTIQWTKFINSHGNNGEFPGKIAADNSGNVYLAGSEIPYLSNQGYNAVLKKYDTNGLLLWTTTYNSPNNAQDEYLSVALDGAETSIYAVGFETRSDLGQDRNLMIKKFDSNGLLQWSTTYNNPDNLRDNLQDVAVDGSGNVLVAGYENRTGEGDNLTLRKYDSAGLLLWTTTYNAASGNDRANGVALDSSGNAFVAGSEIVGNDHILVRKYSSGGSLSWTTSIDMGNVDQAKGVAVDGFGNAYVTGVEDRTDLGQGPNGFVRKFDPNGLIIWTTSYHNGSDDHNLDILVDNTGNVYVTGRNGAAGFTSAFIRKYVQNIPQAPTSLTGVAQSSSSILWTWVDVSTGYQYAEEGTAIVRSTDNVVLSSYTVINAGTSSYLLAGLSPNASATLYLQAYNIAGTSNTAPIIAYSSANIPLTNGSTFTAVTGYSITAAWLSNNNPSWTQYVVDISTWNGFAGTVTSSTTFLTSVSTTGLTPGGTYYFRVKARNVNNDDTPYLDLGSTRTVQDITAPNAITNLTAMLGNSEATVLLSWTSPGDDGLNGTLVAGSSFTVQYTTDAAFAGWSPTAAQDAHVFRVSFATSGVAPSSQQTSIVTGLAIGTTYYFRMWTSDESGNYAAISNGATSYPVGFEIALSTGKFSLNIAYLSMADLDKDGDLDIIIKESNSVQLFLNNGIGGYSGSTSVNLSGGVNNVTWGDINNDGYPDIIAGLASSAKIVVNRGGAISAGVDVHNSGNGQPSGISLGDLNNDGLLDMVFGDSDLGVYVNKNNGNESFTEVWTAGVGNVHNCALGDYDGDGDLDILFISSPNSKIYRNDGNFNFTEVWTAAEGNNGRTAAWGDYDSDGDLDALIGNRVYRNDGSATFTLVWTSPATDGGFYPGSWGDYDNDGDLDILTAAGIVYRNDASVDFVRAWSPARSNNRTAVWGDYDNDGYLDIIAANTATGAEVYRNNRAGAGLGANSIPSAPSGLAAEFEHSVGQSTITFKWDAGSDGGYSANSLYYNLVVATRPTALSGDSLRVTSPSSFTITSVNGSALLGNYVRPALKTWPGDGAAKYGQVLTSTMVYSETRPTKLLIDTSYYYRVQTIDSGLKTSVWSAESVIVSSVAPSAVTDLAAQTGNSTGTITLAWTSPGDDGTLGTATRYLIRMSTTASQAPALSIANFNAAMDVNSTSTVPTPLAAGTSVQFMTITGLLQDVTYYFAIRAADEIGTLGALSNAATAAAQTAILSVSIDSDTYNFGTFTAVQSTIAARAIVVTNSGNVPERYYVKVQTATPNSPWSIQSARGVDQVVVNALFNSARPADGEFEAVQSTMTLSNQLSGSGGGNFAGDQTGENVAIGSARNLWFRLGMPTSTSSTLEQEMQVTITAEQSP